METVGAMVVVTAMEASPLTLSLIYTAHMLATVVWIGGILYQALFLQPALVSIQDPEISLRLFERLRQRFQPTAWLSLAVLIGTGMIQMAANPYYEGFLAIENTWAKAILLKHLVIIAMIVVAALQSFVLYPKLTRSLLLQTKAIDPPAEYRDVAKEKNLIRLNILLSIVVLLLTAIARAA